MLWTGDLTFQPGRREAAPPAEEIPAAAFVRGKRSAELEIAALGNDARSAMELFATNDVEHNTTLLHHAFVLVVLGLHTMII